MQEIDGYGLIAQGSNDQEFLDSLTDGHIRHAERIRQCLQEGRVIVHFTKENGDKRSMLATTKLDFIPTEKLPKSKRKTPETDALLIKAFDLDITEWRSFKADRVISYYRMGF